MGPRDGLQSISPILPTAAKLEWLQHAHAAGQREIEVGSFVPPRLLPQLADTAEVLAFANTLPGLHASVVVPNLHGAWRALEGQAYLMVIPLSASHAHSLANLRKRPDEVLAEIAQIRQARDAAGARTLIEVGISTAFGCTLQGVVKSSEVLRLVQGALDAGVDRVSIADSVGYAGPAQVRSLFEACRTIAGERLSAAHFHDTRGLGLANVMAALDVGIRRFDASLGGIGGCPYAPGAGGNVVTEDLVFMLSGMGFETGQDIDGLLELRARLAGWLEGVPLYGTLARAGLPLTFRRPDHTKNEEASAHHE